MSLICLIVPFALARPLETFSLEAAVLVLTITSSCSTSPAFLTLNVTLPAETVFGLGVTLNSDSVTLTDFEEAARALETAAVETRPAASAPSTARRWSIDLIPGRYAECARGVPRQGERNAWGLLRRERFPVNVSPRAVMRTASRADTIAN